MKRHRRSAAVLAALLAAAGAGCGDAEAPDPGFPAGEWVEAPGHTGETPRDADRAVNGVRGGGGTAGGNDTFSLGYEAGVDDVLVLSWGGAVVRNGPGTDFVVFENGFRAGASYMFMDLAIVSVSRDGATWVPFPHDYAAPDEAVYVADPAAWPGFAGRTPVLYNVDTHPVDPFDAQEAGGDGYDLDDLPADGGEADAIRAEGFRFVRLEAAPARTNPDTGAPYVRDAASNGADIDGVIARRVDPTGR